MFFFAHAFPSSVPNCVRKMSFGCGFRDICLCVCTAYSLYRHTDSLLLFSFLFIIVDLHTKFLSLVLFLTVLISIREQMMITNFISLVHWWRSLTRLFFASWIYTIYTGQTNGWPSGYFTQFLFYYLVLQTANFEQNDSQNYCFAHFWPIVLLFFWHVRFFFSVFIRLHFLVILNSTLTSNTHYSVIITVICSLDVYDFENVWRSISYCHCYTVVELLLLLLLSSLIFLFSFIHF